MPIEFSDIGKDDKWAGSDWTVTDPSDLAHHIARVALGQVQMKPLRTPNRMGDKGDMGLRSIGNIFIG